MSTMEYKVGLIVEHSKLPEYGRGKILSVKDLSIEILFANGHTIKFSTANLQLRIANDQSDPCPNPRSVYSLPGSTKRVLRRPQRSLPSFQQSMEDFQRRFPQGFSDPEYIKQEREYKLNTHNLFLEILGKGQLKHLLAENNIDELIKRTLRVITEHKINLIFKNERIAFTEGLKSNRSIVAFFGTLANLLEKGPVDDALTDYFKAASELPQIGKSSPNKWTVALLLPFLAHPERFVFLKPEPTKDCADQLNHSLNYKAVPNLLTYRCLESLYDRLANRELKPLSPKDNIDIQSFIWRVWSDRD